MTSDLSAAGARSKAREVQDSTAFEGLARLGLAARGVVWLVIGLLALSVLLGGHDRRTDQQGALQEIASKPFGTALLVVLAVGFASYAAWRAVTAAVGHQDESEERKRLAKRIWSAAKAILYAGFAITTLRFVISHPTGGDRTSSFTADAMKHTGGRWVVGLVGVAVVVTGVAMVVRALQGKHVKKLEQQKVPDGLQRAAKSVGTVGLSGRGLVVGLIGSFLLRAAVTFDPAKAKGLDAALQTLAGQPYGRVLLAVAVVAVLGYAAWCFVEAAYRRL
jgi:hypothetical protein